MFVGRGKILRCAQDDGAQQFFPIRMIATAMPTRPRRTLAALLLAAALSGCVEHRVPAPGEAVSLDTPAPTPPPLTTEPIGVQMTRAEPRLAGTPFRVLLDFERPTDAAFLISRGGTCVPSTPDAAHTGQAALKLDGPGGIEIKLPSLVSGSPFPGAWTLAGAYVRAADGPSRVTLSYRLLSTGETLAHRTIDLADAKRWTPLFLDLTTLPTTSAAEVGQLTLQVEGGPAYCDDVCLLNNTRVFEAPPPGVRLGVGWTIKQGGSEISIERVGRFRLAFKTPEVAPADGWTIEEACDVRARLVSVTGETWTVYLDGRQYRDAKFGALVPMMGNATTYYAEQHASPAELVVPEEFGRIDRDTPGDRNNDGYNERRGSYQLVAKGSRFEVLIRPHATPLLHPVLEISGLAHGEPLVTVEGHLVERTTRLPSGTLLFEIPGALRRPTTVNISIK
jgi:hypothetical protein